MNRDFDFDVRFILDKRERSFHEVYILPFEPREIAQSGPGEVPREDHSAPFPIGGIKQFEDLIWSKRGDDEAGRIVDIQGALGIAAEGNIDLAGISIWNPTVFPRIPSETRVSFVPIRKRGGKIGRSGSRSVVNASSRISARVLKNLRKSRTTLTCSG